MEWHDLLNYAGKNTALEEFDYIYKNNKWGDEQLQADIFVKVLSLIKNQKPSMIELGSGGTDSCGYSILFEKYFNYNCNIILTEPRKHLLENIRVLWKDKHLKKAICYVAYTGQFKGVQSNEQLILGVPTYRVSEMMSDSKLCSLDILHADIQGSEVSVLEELIEDNIVKKIRFFFISTHTVDDENTHNACEELLSKSFPVKYHFSNPGKGGCGDGLIVAENLNYE